MWMSKDTHPDRTIYGPGLDEEREELLHLRASDFRSQVPLETPLRPPINASASYKRVQGSPWVPSTYQALYATRSVAIRLVHRDSTDATVPIRRPSNKIPGTFVLELSL